jgi:lipopolysaccharide export system permease protein
MPLIWRYLIKQYLKVFLLTTLTFIALLLVTRLKEIASFAALGPSAAYILRFILYFIPYILPIAIPIASLLASVLVYQSLSHSHELTALRASGLSLFSLLSPILLVSSVIAIFNFYVVSELTTYSHYASRRLIHELSSVNPLILIENKNLLKLRDIYVHSQTEDKGKSARNLFIVTSNKNNQLNLIHLNHLELENEKLKIESINVLTHLNDKIVIETESDIQTSALNLSKMMKKSSFRVSHDYFTMPHLRLRTQNYYQSYLTDRKPTSQHNPMFALKSYKRCVSEILRRFSVALSVVTFSFLGMSFALQIGRNPQKRKLVTLISLTVLSLISFFTAKALDSNLILSTTLYFFPHLLITLFSFWSLSRISRGIES